MESDHKMNAKDLPQGSAPEPLDFPHFPTRIQAVIWRNWNLVPLERLAKVLYATEEQIEEVGIMMGIAKDLSLCDLWMNRGYLTIIRRNWHLLPYEQLIELLGWTPERMAFTLKEEDFLWSKMGSLKPDAKPVIYAPLTDAQKKETEKLRETVSRHFANESIAKVRPFDFPYNKRKEDVSKKDPLKGNLKLAYAYSALYGDPFINPELDPYPGYLLSDYAECGINAVWLQGTLYTLIPWFGESKYSGNWQARLRNLRTLAARCVNHGIGLYLYMNEPRGMPEDFFSNHPQWKGTGYKGSHALCTSNIEVLEALERGLNRLFTEVPELAGIFTITMSENLTNCLSRLEAPSLCPLCSSRGPEEIVPAVNHAMEKGVHSAKPDADVIVWNWGWQAPWDEKIVERLPENVKLMCVSETDLETDAGGIKGKVADYSISKVGPGPNARRLWGKARQRGLEVVAKVQLNNTWECSELPYIPTPGLIEKHLENIRSEGVSDFMVGWTLGGWPGGNLKLLMKSGRIIAKEDFGFEAAPEIMSAWESFDRAFEHFPLNSCFQLYRGPQNYGPMNLLFRSPTGYEATMIGFPYDDLYTWRGKGHYPEDIFEEQFKKLSEEWAEGLAILLKAKDKVPDGKIVNYDDLLNVAEAAYCHFRSSYLQIRFIRLRDSGESNKIITILDEEIEIAKRLLGIVKRDSRIGFEASNHYYYVGNDLREKVINCEHLKTIYSHST